MKKYRYGFNQISCEWYRRQTLADGTVREWTRRAGEHFDNAVYFDRTPKEQKKTAAWQSAAVRRLNAAYAAGYRD